MLNNRSAGKIKNIIIMKVNNLILMLLCVVALSCTKAVQRDDKSAKEEVMTAPEHIGPINKIPETLLCQKGEEFKFSINAVKWADSYEWNIADAAKDYLTIVDGQGTTVITVKASQKEGTIPRNSVSVVAVNSLGRSRARAFLANLTIGESPVIPDPDTPVIPEDQIMNGYRVKKFGSKIWIIENCREKGENGDLGVAPDASSLTWPIQNDVAERIIKASGRYYTWYEAMTGIAGCTPEQCVYKKGYSGKDDAGNDFTLDGTEAEYNVQIKGCCPEGWHIANTNDWWDLINSIKTEYSVPDDFVQCGYKFNGGHDPAKMEAITKDFFAANGCKVKNIGNVGAWLRGENGRIEDGGVWNQTKTQLSDAGEPLNIFTDGAVEVNFGLYPSARYKSDGTFDTNAIGKWGYIWGIRHGDTDLYASCFNISCSSLNFDLLSKKRPEAEKGGRLSVRCVKNY